MRLTVLTLFLLAIILNAVANILIKASAIKQNIDDPSGYLKSFLNPFLISGLASFALALVAYRFVLGHGMKLSIAYPIMTTAGFAIVILASKIFFHEDLNLVQWIGIALLAAGIWLVAFHAA